MTSGDPGFDGFYRFANAHPDRPAYIDPDGRSVSFGELLAKVNAVSNGLRSLGVVRGDVVAALLHNDRTFFEVVLAAGQLGLYMVPVNWHLTPSEVAYITGDSGAKVLVAHHDLAGALSGVLGELPASCYSVGASTQGWMDYEALFGPETTPAERSAGAIMGYTSGTTGRPKGVKRALPDMSPEELCRTVPDLFGVLGFNHDDGVHLVFSPLYHSAPGGWALMALNRGHTVVCREKFDAETVLRDIEKYRVTTSHMVPTHFVRLLKVPERSKYDLSSLVGVAHAGAPCPVEVKREMIEWFGPVIWEYLASTEGGVVSIVGPQDWLLKPGTVGKAPPGTDVKLLDENGVEVPRGEAGIIYARNGHSNFVYHNAAEKTRASHVEGGFATAGDIGRLDEDGYLFLLDRRNDLILSGGVNVYPAEIEGCLINHPAVEDVAVIGVDDPEWGQSVLAVVQPVNRSLAGDELAEVLQTFCRKTLASYKCPRRIEFLEEFPRTTAGKLQRNVLRERYNINLKTGQ